MRRMSRYLVPSLFGLALYFALFGGEYSAFEVRSARGDLTESEAALAELRLRNDSLRALADSLQRDPAALERLAREDFGMIRDGEILYRFAEPDEDEEARDSREDRERAAPDRAGEPGSEGRGSEPPRPRRGAA